MTRVAGRLRPLLDRLGARAVVATEGELVEELPHGEAELLAGTGALGDAGEGGIEALWGMRGEPLGTCGEGRGHRWNGRRPSPFQRTVTIHAVEQPAQGPVEQREILSGVRLWRVELDVDADAEAELLETLSADELARADRLAKQGDRRRFVVARGTLRRRLGNMLGEQPRTVPIEDGSSCKPRLGRGWKLHFSISHSGDLALICIAGVEVGVDLELLRHVPSAAAIARRRFSAEEARFVEQGEGEAASGRASEVERRFLRCWTRKEAVVKAIGAGLAFDLRSFAVPLEPGGGVVQLDDPGGGRPQRWLLNDVPLGADHVAALALAAPDEKPSLEQRSPAFEDDQERVERAEPPNAIATPG